jgi:hypothetical protein
MGKGCCPMGNADVAAETEDMLKTWWDRVW